MSRLLGSTLAFGLVAASLPSLGAEVSVLSGLYKKESSDNNGQSGGDKSSIQVGGRYSDALSVQLHWYAQADLTLDSYGENAAGVAPSNATSLNLGGGVRHYFGKIGENFATYARGGGAYKSEKIGSFTANSASSIERNGLYYGAGFGIRLYLGTKFFCDFEAPLFESALFATETEITETSAAAGATVTNERETKKTELFATSEGSLNKVIVSLGLKI